ncbi:MAG TPA: PA domain-containing protein [Haliangiales bacterium]|nr:PA domain-containing protein [Haliangiales bacterium]
MRRLALIAALALAPAAASAAVTITVFNANAPGVGFNDPTPAAPIGGNPGTTLGQQRLFAFSYAAGIWGATLDSVTPIRIFATFEPLACTPTSATLGSAGATSVFRDFPGAQLANTWYPVALVGKLLGADPLVPGPNIGNNHIRARFNSNLGNAGCLTGVGWYLGIDNNHGGNIDLVTVLLHEFGHGLGFQTFTSVSTGAFLAGFSDTFAHRLADNTTGKAWEQMTQAERQASIRNGRHLVWTGPEVTAAVPATLAPGTPLLHVGAPASIAGDYVVGAATFGPQLTPTPVSGTVVAALDPADGAGPSTFDACSPLTNAAAVAGHIALVDRGSCTFVTKVKNAQNAGAIAVIVADNAAGSPPAALGGADPTIVIPSVRVTQADGAKIRAALAGGVSASLRSDPSVRAGADAQNRALMFAVDPIVLGSSVSHWDTSAFPNLLMEPAINADLTHGLDLTLPEMRDIGWYPDADLDFVPDTIDACLGSDLSNTVVITGCDSGVTNFFFQQGADIGCSVADLIRRCVAGAGNHGEYVSCASHTTNALKDAGILTGADHGAIQSCAAGSSLP